MSLISDTDFLIHSLRLAYLREVEDPYASRVISLDPSYQSNPYIAAANLADENRWPELHMPNSPTVSDDDQDRPLGFPRARLKYTQTIMGGKSGGAGLRVNGKRMSTSKRMSASTAGSAAGMPKIEVQNFVTGGAPVQDALSTTATGGSALGKDDSWVKVEPEQSKEEDKKENNKEAQPDVQLQAPTAVEEAPVQKPVPFVPKFKGAAEMAARRRVRLAARQAPGGSMAPPPPPQPQPTLSFDSSSEEEDEEDDIPPVEEEEEGVEVDTDDEEDEFGDELGGTSSMGEEDEFDPEFAANRSTVLSSSSELASVLSGATTSISNSSIPLSTSKRIHNPPPGPRQPKRTNTNNTSARRRSVIFEMITPPPPKPSSSSSKTPDPLFAKKKVVPPKPAKSTLSSMLASSGPSSNPFTEMYAAISGRGEAASTTVQVYFPHAKEPSGKPMMLRVRKDATVEEVIGFALWSYWEEGWLPKIDDGVEEGNPKLSAVGWILRIAEDDGEVDDDFPPPDRMGKITKFNSEAYAVLEATLSQVQQNQVLESKIQRRPSRITSSKKPDNSKLTVPNPAPSLIANSSSLINNGTPFGSVPLSTSLGRSHQGPQIFLRIHTADAVHISTTIPVSAGMYMQEALEMVARKRKLNPKDYALLLSEDKKILIPLDRTVASLQGKRELLLVKRSLLQQMGVDTGRGVGRTTDPNASIFKRMSDTPEVQFSSAYSDFTAAYKKYTIYRKMPMLVTRQERTLAIDGVYIHIMPVSKANKVMFDSGKTASYHIKSIADCQQSAKTSSTFKLVLNRGSGSKRYDFEAENPKLAAEIVQTIKGLKAALERSGTVNKSRRSRHIG